MSKVGTTYVPSIGPPDAKIMIVGEAPGADEEVAREPFVGKAGQLLTRFLESVGLMRTEVYLTNLCKHRPQSNKFKNLLETDELKVGLEELASEIKTVNPTVILAAGGWPLYYLTGQHGSKPGEGILLWRGSVLPNTLVPDGPKVLATVHPSFILRTWSQHPIFHFDLKRLVRNSQFPEIRYPIYHSMINPSPEETATIVDRLIAKPPKIITCDIETHGAGRLACIGFGWREENGDLSGLCVGGSHASLSEASRLYGAAVPLYFQFGTYDINWLRFFLQWHVGNYAGDTFIAAASLMPSFKRGLDFLTSIYTDFPYYKEERKDWHESGDLNTLYEYNIKDVIATLIIAEEQAKELEEQFNA